MDIGYALIAEEHPANDLVGNAVRAETAGADYVSISDHFHPWLEEQGNSPFAWTVLGALAHQVSVPLMTAVTAPILRYHPAIIAQAAATVATMTDARFVLGLGAGEALNEHIVGERWPDPGTRLDMLDEAIGVIAELWGGEDVNHRGEFYVVDRARLYSLPADPPAMAVAAGGSDVAALAARRGAGLVLTSADEDVITAYHDAGGDGELWGQTTVCWAPDDDEGKKLIRDRWRHAFLSWNGKADIPTPAGFADASQLVGPDLLGDGMPTGPDLDGLEDDLGEFADAGFDHVAIHCVGPYQREFLDHLDERLPDLRNAVS